MNSTRSSCDTSDAGASDGARITTTDEGLCVSVAPRRDWLWGIYFGLFLLGWTIGEMSAATMLLLQTRPTAATLFLMGWLVAWSFAGYFIGSRRLFMFFGREQIIVSPTSVILRATVLGQSRSQAFDVKRVRNIRAGLGPASGPGPGACHRLKFDVAGKPHAFGNTLTTATCQTIQDAIERSQHMATPTTTSPRAPSGA